MTKHDVESLKECKSEQTLVSSFGFCQSQGRREDWNKNSRGNSGVEMDIDVDKREELKCEGLQK